MARYAAIVGVRQIEIDIDIDTHSIDHGQLAFKRAPTTPWHSNNQVAGTVKTAGTLTYVTVNGAGHMVPMDQPAFALTIVNNIIFDIPFS